MNARTAKTLNQPGHPPSLNPNSLHADSEDSDQWLSDIVLDSRPMGRGFEPHRRHSVVSLSKDINPSLDLIQPKKIRPNITERLLMGRKETNQSINQVFSRRTGTLLVFPCHGSFTDDTTVNPV